MRIKSCTLIVLKSGSPSLFRLRLSRKALALVGLAGLTSFLLTVLVGIYTPRTFNEAEALRLRRENQTLRIQNNSAELDRNKLDSEVRDLQRRSEQMIDAMKTE